MRETSTPVLIQTSVILVIAVQEPRELDIFVDPVTYTEQQLAALMSQLHSGNSRHGGVRLVFLVCTPSDLLACLVIG